MRIRFHPAALLAAFLALACPAHLRAQDPPPPNVILVVVDDLGWADLGCTGSTYHETPNLDRLAQQGVRFTDAYAACAVCSPTRAALLTGRSPARTGITDWIRARFQRPGGATPEAHPTDYEGGPRQALLCPPNPFWLDLDEVTIAELLAERGYATAHIGKWHLGDDAWYPEHQGFAENFGGCDYGQPPTYLDPFTTKSLPQGIPGLPGRTPGQYLTDREADEAVAFVGRNSARPFYLHLCHYAVHTPIEADPARLRHYRAKPKTNQANAAYATMVESVDRAMGRILAALDEHGIADRTLVVFTSDNGGLVPVTDNAPLRSGKGTQYEGGIRVPLLVRWPGVIAAGCVDALPVTSVDWLPTIAAATGAPLPGRELDGISLLPRLRDPGATMPGRRLFWHFPHYRGELGPHGIVRDGRWKLIEHHAGPRFELYDLAADLGERRDLAPAQPERVQALSAALHEHLAAVGARLPRPNPAHRPLPRVLLLGDSISMGYHEDVKRLLRGEAEVFRPMRNFNDAENCAGTDHGLRRIEAWLTAEGGRWDVIHANFGLHDLKHVQPGTGANSNDPSHPPQTPVDEYEKQLDTLVAAMVKTGATVVLATTTPVPDGPVRPFRAPADVARYNAALVAVAARHGCAVNDLDGTVRDRLGELQRRADVHFTPAGSRVLGEAVAARIRQSLRR